ncbi:MAG: hypothetical protein ABFS56_07400 [Pseudomonadota bacterium]
MSYGNFKSVSEVARKFNLKVVDNYFIEQKEIKVSEIYFSDLKNRLRTSINFINEFTICEEIIRPILDIIAANHTNLDIWSHVSYNVDAEKGLIGEPDYLIAPRTKYGDMERPAICVIEAKQEKFDEGWAQALAEMVASSLQGTEICYSSVTTGKAWEFGHLKEGTFTKHPIQISATSDLQKIFDILNWLFYKTSIAYSNP